MISLDLAAESVGLDSIIEIVYLWVFDMTDIVCGAAVNYFLLWDWEVRVPVFLMFVTDLVYRKLLVIFVS